MLAIVLSCGIVSAQQAGDGEKLTVHAKANRIRPVDVANSTAIVMVDNVVAYHNGSIITCDSLIQYNSLHIECFGNVIVNKDSTFVYGDRLDYDGERNVAQVFSPLVKMIDGDAILYTYNFLFNTLDNIGEYYGGGTMTRDGTLLESDRGFYYSDSRDVICVGNVELRDSTYQIISDSLGYNMDSEVATFYSQSYIWNEKGEILSADKGWYYTKEERYRFISNAYVLTDKQEIWADDIDYRADLEDIIMRRNIQIRDEEQKTIGFGDYGLYFGQSGNAMLTEGPSVINFEEGDSVYMRADSIFMYILDSTSVYSSEYAGNKQAQTTASDGSLIGEETLITPGRQAAVQEKREELTGEIEAAETGAMKPEDIPAEITPQSMQGAATDAGTTVTDGETPQGEVESSPDGAQAETGQGNASLTDSGTEVAADGEPAGDGAEVDTSQPDKPKTKAELRAERKAEKEREKAERQAAKEQKRKEKEAKRKGSSRSAETNDTAAQAADSVGVNQSVASADSADNADISETSGAESEGRDDSTATEAAEGETVISDSTTTEGTTEGMAAEGETPVGEGATEEEPAGEKERERVVVGYHDVKIFRSDFQAVCDSLISFSVDSTIHMHKKPILWNGDNQITSDLAVIHTKNEELYKAVFSGGTPFMGTNLDAVRYNQVAGKTIEAFFEKNEVYRVDALGNGKTYYYIQDEETRDYQGFLVVECADITFHISNRNVDRIVYNVNPVYSIYPMNKIPPSQEQVMQGFEWFGSLKPVKTDVFDRVEKPTQREHYLGLPLPQFPLSDKIHKRRRTLINGGTWQDRTDDISRNAKDFMHDVEGGILKL